MDNKGKGIYPSSVTEDLIICMGAVYFTAAFCCDEYLTGKIMTLIRLVSTAAMLLCWFGMSFFNGIRMRKSFAVISSVFLLFPVAVFMLYEKVRIFRFSDIGLIAKKAAEITGVYPYLETERITGINGIYISALLCGVCLALFISGYYYTKINIIGDKRSDERK